MASEVQKVAESRWKDTKMRGFHQIVALTQDCINASFDFRYEQERAIAEANHDKAKSLRRLYVELSSMHSSIEGQMNAPTVEFAHESDQNDEQAPRIIFRLNFQSGTLQYYRSVEDVLGGHKTKVTLDGWSVGYLVDIGSGSKIRKAEADKHIPTEVLNQINLPGNYEIAQVLFLFSNAEVSTFRPLSSHTPGIQKEDQDMFNLLMGKYLTDFCSKRYNTVGYAITVPEVEEYRKKATCPPTEVRYQAMAHRLSTSKVPVSSSGSSLFLFLEMTNHDKFPSDSLGWTGNWVGTGQSGAMAIRKASIWDGYILPLTIPILKESVMLVNSYIPWAWPEYAKDEKDRTWYLSDNKHGPADDTFKWKGETKEGDGHSFEWSVSTELKSNYISASASVSTSQNLVANVTATAKWVAGTNQIMIQITQDLKSTVEISSSVGLAGLLFRKPNTTTYSIKVEWVVYITIVSVDKGDLDVGVICETPQATTPSEFEKSWFHKLFGTTNSKQDTLDKVLKAVNDTLGKTTLKSTLADAINKQKHFVVSGGGTFFFDSPIFNKEGDLIIELTWVNK